MNLLQLFYSIKSSQLLTVIYNHPGDTTPDSRNLFKFGCVCLVEADNSTGLILEYRVFSYVLYGEQSHCIFGAELFCNPDVGKKSLILFFLQPIYFPEILRMSEYPLSSSDREGKWIHSANQIPTENNYEDIARPALAQAWRSFFDYNPQKGILVMATQLGEALEIYNFTDTTQTVRYGPNGEPQFAISQSEGIPTGIMGFSDVHITDNFIYTVFHGRSFKDIGQAYQRGEDIEDGGRYIYVFDLKGNPVRKYVLDHAIYGIDVDEDTGTILATDVNSNDPILSFKI